MCFLRTQSTNPSKINVIPSRISTSGTKNSILPSVKNSSSQTKSTLIAALKFLNVQLPNKGHTVLDIFCCMPQSKREDSSALWIHFCNAWGQLTGCSPRWHQERDSRSEHGSSSINEVRVICVAPLNNDRFIYTTP